MAAEHPGGDAGFQLGRAAIPRSGDGVADDTAAIQRALAAGGWITFSPGEYRITGTIEITRDDTHWLRREDHA